MSTIINATTTNGVVIQPDNSGSLQLATNNGTTAVTIDTSQNLQFNSGYGSVATAYGCRAWVNFNGTGTVAIRASGNVSSITDNGTGDYTINFTNSMPDVNYSIHGTSGQAAAASPMNIIGRNLDNSSQVAGSVRIYNLNTSSSTTDNPNMCLAVFR
jgi:uncharacterized protein (AIM24 family)